MTGDEVAASRAALASLDALHDADPASLNAETRALRRLMRVRRVLYYSILYPFGLLARAVHPAVVPISALAALLATIVALAAGAPGWLVAMLGYWAAGGITYHVISLLMAGSLDKAAASVDLDPREVLRTWLAQS